LRRYLAVRRRGRRGWRERGWSGPMSTSGRWRHHSTAIVVYDQDALKMPQF